MLRLNCIGAPDIIVAVIDTGTDLSHPDLKDNLWINSHEIPGNGIDDDGNGETPHAAVLGTWLPTCLARCARLLWCVCTATSGQHQHERLLKHERLSGDVDWA